MTAAQTYTVDVVYHGRDQGAQGMADHIGVSLQGLQGRLDAVTSGMERLAMVGVAAIGGVAAMGVRTLARDMVHLNSLTEDTTIGIAGMLQANGGAATFAAGMNQAGAALAQIRRDADALPGEAQDFVNVFSTALPAAMQAGMTNALDVARFTNQFAAVGIALHVDAEQSGRDLRLLLQGRAGAQVAMWNQLQSLVGKTAEQFNQMTAPQRLSALQRATGRYGDMVNAFGGTFSTAITTVIGRAHRLEELATKPLFDRATARLQEMGTYLTTHAPEIEARVVRWGEAGAHAFDVLFERGRKAVSWLRENWRSMLNEGIALGERAVAVYSVARAGSAAFSLASGASSIAGALGSGGAAGGAGAAGASLAAVGAVGAGATLTGASIALADRNGVASVRDSLKELRGPAHLAGDRLHFLWTQVEPLAAAAGGILLSGVTSLAGAALKVVTVFSDIASIVPTAFNALRLFTADLIRGVASPGAGAQLSATQSAQFAANEFQARDRERYNADVRDHMIAHVAARVVENSGMHAAIQRKAQLHAPRPAAHNPHHTTINNHFKIEQADNPERVALSVLHVMRRELRNPTQSARPGVATLR